jgi:uncharacterized protein (DUF342 family)
MPDYTSPEAIAAYYAALAEPVNAQIEQTEKDYKTAQKQLAQEKAAADAQAYRSHMRQLRMYPDVASASGSHGGMVGSALAFQNAAYQQGRNDRDVQLARDKNSLLSNYNNTLNQLRAQASQYKGMADAAQAELKYQQGKNAVPTNNNVTGTVAVANKKKKGSNLSSLG